MIVISPFSKALRSGKNNPKNYPFWPELVKEIQKKMQVVQVGVEGEEQLVPDFRKNLSLPALRALIQMCDTWISCDSFFQHLGWDEGKRGIVLWAVSDPLIFGHPENVNLLKDRANLVKNQFLWWEATDHDPDKFVSPNEVMIALTSLLAAEKIRETN